MNEVNRLQKLAGINEIKVIKPSDKVFIVTDLGRQIVEDFVTMEKLSQKFGCGELLKNEGPESDLYRIPQLLYIFSDTYGEGIIQMNEINRKEDYLRIYMARWDDEGNNAIEELENFKKFNLIK